MKRWVIVALVVVLPLLGLAFLARHQASPSTSPVLVDEILAYEITPSRGASVRVPGELDEMLVTTWALIPPRLRYEPEARFPYSFVVTFTDSSGRSLEGRRFEPETRVLLPDGSSNEFAARIPGSHEWVGDGRTASVRVPSAMRAGGTARIAWASGDGVSSFLVRIAYRQVRGPAERFAFARALTDEQRRGLDENRTALGFDDLATISQDNALGTWGRRLDADGQEGVDYSVRRLLLGTLKSTARVATGVHAGFMLSARHSAAFNFDGPVRLDLSMPSEGDVFVTDGNGARLLLVPVPEQRVLRFVDARTGPRTIRFEANTDHDVRVHFIVATPDARAQIGTPRSIPRGDTTELMPDVRMLRAARLDPGAPVTARVAPGQVHLRLFVRGELGSDDRQEEVRGSVTIRWKDKVGHAREALMPVRLARSKLDRWRSGSDATEAATGTIRLPDGTSDVEIFGDRGLSINLMVEDPLVTEDVLSLPYRIALPSGEHWRNAPFDLRAFQPIQPANIEALEREKRTGELAVQVRIEGTGARGGRPPRPETTLTPDGIPFARRFLERTTLEAGDVPPDTWSDLRGGRTLTVAAAGATAGALRINYVAGSAQLGSEARVLVDGRSAATRRLMVRSGSFALDVPPGNHAVAVEGLGDDGFALASAPPARGGAVVRRRVVHELTRAAPLTYAFDQPPGKTVTVVLMIATEANAQDYTLVYRLDNPGAERIGELFHTATVISNALAGKTGDAGTGVFWETTTPLAGTWTAGFSRATLRIGDDRAGTARKLTVRLTGTLDRAFVRAVLIGGVASPREDTQQWTLEDEAAE